MTKKVYLYGQPDLRINYIEALESCGAQVVVSTDPQDALSCNALLLPGGADLDPALFGEENCGSKGIDRELDLVEISLAKSFFRQHKPILGICRGMQLLNVAFGGSLIQDLPTAATHRWEEATGDKTHPIAVPDDSFLSKLYGANFWVNSAHHQGVGRLAEGFQISARAEDGVVEAIEWRQQEIYGVQWHPERLTLRHKRPDAVDGREVFAFFMKLL